MVTELALKFRSWTDLSRGRALSYQLLDGIDGGITRTWSSLALQPQSLSSRMPIPIITAVERPPGNRKQLSCMC